MQTLSRLSDMRAEDFDGTIRGSITTPRATVELHDQGDRQGDGLSIPANIKG